MQPKRDRPPPPASPVIGWREWVALPELGVPSVKAKVDTGARTSSLHAFDLEFEKRRGSEWVRFGIHPEQRSARFATTVEARVLEWRSVRSSSGRAERRPVILTEVELLGRRFEVELTLTSRDAMGFRMLLGREATRRRFLVDPGRSFLNGRRRKGSRKLARRHDSK